MRAQRTVDVAGRELTRERVKALVDALEVTQDEFAEMTAGNLSRQAVNFAYTGRVKAGSAAWPEGIARALEVTMQEAQDYLRGRISLDTLLARRGGEKPTEPKVIPGFPNLTRAIAAMRVAFPDDPATEAVIADVKAPPEEDRVLNVSHWLSELLNARRVRLQAATGAQGTMGKVIPRVRVETARAVRDSVNDFETTMAELAPGAKPQPALASGDPESAAKIRTPKPRR
jgi:hypothetical protein